MVKNLLYSWWTAPRGLPSSNVTTLARLSVTLGRRHFARTVLITDNAGAQWASEHLAGLFDEVRTDLENLPPSCAKIWALGKIAAASCMTEPFMHLDFDAFLWKAPPARLLSAPVFAERAASIDPAAVQTILADMQPPEQWRQALEGYEPRQLCCGIFGGHDLATLHSWAKASLSLAESGAHRAESGRLASIVLEQFGLAAFAPGAATLFAGGEPPSDAEAAAVGFTHLVGEKARPEVIARARERLERGDFTPRYPAAGAGTGYGYGYGYTANLPAPSVPSDPLGLVILTHAAYSRHLPAVLHAVQAQRADLGEIVLVLNGAGVHVPPLPRGVRIVRGEWESPQDARNAGLEAATSSAWLCYLDGDNIPSAGYFGAMRRAVNAAPESVAMLYPGTVLRVTEDTAAERVFVMPEWDEHEARAKSICDTAAAWRASALRSAGGWFTQSGMLDDYTTALQLIAEGWKGQRVADAVAVLRHHEGRRSRQIDTIPVTLWHARRHALVTLFAGRSEPLAPLVDWYCRAELPPQTVVYWVDNSRSADFRARLWEAAAKLGKRPEVQGVSIIRDDRTCRPTFAGIHSHVASLYNRTLRAVSADAIVTIEDDVIPPLSALPAILAPLQPWTKNAAVAAVYPSRENPHVANVALEKLQWVRMPRIAALPANSVVPVGMVAGGCTAWSAPHLKRMLPLQISPRLGWDGNLCRRMNEAGLRLTLATGVRCAHLCR